VVVEGAGSPAEINLRTDDIATWDLPNMSIVRWSSSPTSSSGKCSPISTARWPCCRKANGPYPGFRHQSVSRRPRARVGRINLRHPPDASHLHRVAAIPDLIYGLPPAGDGAPAAAPITAPGARAW